MFHSFFDVSRSLLHGSEHQLSGCQFRPSRVHTYENLKNLPVRVASGSRHTVKLINPEVSVVVQNRMKLLDIGSDLPFTPPSVVSRLRGKNRL